MDPLSVAASVAGLLKGAHELGIILGPYIAATKEAPPIAHRVHSEVQNTKIVLSAVQTLTQNLSSVNARNASLIQIDQIVAVLTDGVLIFSELEVACGVLKNQQPSTLRLRSRLNLVRKEGDLSALLMRLQGFKDSLTLMLTILQCDSDFRAAQHREKLAENINTLLEGNEGLSRRLMDLEDAFDVQNVVANKRRSIAGSIDLPPYNSQPSSPRPARPESTISSSFSQLSLTPDNSSIASSEFQSDLESSRVYQRARKGTIDSAFRNSMIGAGSFTGSVFSGLSLGDVSIMSVIALPVYAKDLSNPQHYDFGNDDLEKEEPPAPLPPSPAPPSQIAPSSSQSSPEGNERSIYHDCLELKLQLMQLDDFRPLFAVDRTPEEKSDPMNELMEVFRRGYPLIMLFNKFQYRWSVDVFKRTDRNDYPKQAAAEFIQACRDELGIRGWSMFTIAELLGGDIFDFHKVVNVLKYIITRIPDFPQTTLPLPSTDGMYVQLKTLVTEFLTEERAYFIEIGKLARTVANLGETGILSTASIREAFPPLSWFCRFQLQLLLDMEGMAYRPAPEQRWAGPFHKWSEAAETCYTDFAVHEQNKRDMLSAWAVKCEAIDASTKPMFEICIDFLPLPYARMKKYLSFLQVLPLYQSQWGTVNMVAIDALRSSLKKIDQARVEQELEVIFEDLKKRVADWKGHDPTTFGKLVISDRAPVQVGPTTRTYQVYLFEKVLFICMEVLPTRATRNLQLLRLRSAKVKEKAKLVIKGRIFGANILEVHGKSDFGSHTCEIAWKGGDGREFMTIEFSSRPRMLEWEAALNDAKLPKYI